MIGNVPSTLEKHVKPNVLTSVFLFFPLAQRWSYDPNAVDGKA